jgi:hypothetical protein
MPSSVVSQVTGGNKCTRRTTHAVANPDAGQTLAPSGFAPALDTTVDVDREFQAVPRGGHD